MSEPSNREPLSEDKLAEYTAWAAHLADEGLPVTGEMVHALLAEVARLKGRLAFEAEAYEAVNGYKNGLLRSGRKLVALAREVAKEYEDAADWKDDRTRLQQMAHDALSEAEAP